MNDRVREREREREKGGGEAVVRENDKETY